MAFAESRDAACEVENNSEALRRSNERKHRSEKSEGESVGLNTRSSSRPNALAIRFVLGVIFNGNDVEVRTVTNRSPFISSIGVGGTNGLAKSCPKSSEATETRLRFRVEYVLETLARGGVRFIVVQVGVIVSVTLPYSSDMTVCRGMEKRDPESGDATSKSSQNPVALDRDAWSIVEIGRAHV